MAAGPHKLGLWVDPDKGYWVGLWGIGQPSSGDTGTAVTASPEGKAEGMTDPLGPQGDTAYGIPYFFQLNK